MKLIFTACFLFLLFLQSEAQTDSVQMIPVQVDTLQLKKGFYTSYEEYLSNSPSITLAFETDVYRVSKNDSTIVSAKYHLLDSSGKVKGIWGFCDGENVFVKYGRILGHQFWKLQCPGPNPYLFFKDKMLVAVGPPVMALATLAITASLPPSYEVLLINKSGKVKNPTKKNMRSILADTPELLTAFKNIKVLYDTMVVKYLKLYNETKK